MYLSRAKHVTLVYNINIEVKSLIVTSNSVLSLQFEKTVGLVPL